MVDVTHDGTGKSYEESSVEICHNACVDPINRVVECGRLNTNLAKLTDEFVHGGFDVEIR